MGEQETAGEGEEAEVAVAEVMEGMVLACVGSAVDEALRLEMAKVAEEVAKVVGGFVDGAVDEALDEFMENLDTRSDAERVMDALLESMGLEEDEAVEAAAKIQARLRGKKTRTRLKVDWIRGYVVDLAAGVARIMAKNDEWMETGVMETWHDPTAPAGPSVYAGNNMAPCVTVRNMRTGRINSIG